MRQISKLLINSLWGRFGLRRDLPMHVFVSDANEICEVMDRQEHTITNLLPMHENIVLMTYKKSDPDFYEMNNDANIYIAACTTAYGRIELYQKMKMLQERVVYCDTDSIIYIHGQNDLQTGPFLGELTNELKDGDYIKKFVSGGPKNYAYETEKGEKCIKVKGFTLTKTNLDAFNFENIKEILTSLPFDISEENLDDPVAEETPQHQTDRGPSIPIWKGNQRSRRIALWRDRAFEEIHSLNPQIASAGNTENYISTFNPNKIVRSKKWQLLSKPEQKIFTIMYDKRRVLNNYDTIPFGF